MTRVRSKLARTKSVAEKLTKHKRSSLFVPSASDKKQSFVTLEPDEESQQDDDHQEGTPQLQLHLPDEQKMVYFDS
jgi:hypothetical protein